MPNGNFSDTRTIRILNCCLATWDYSPASLCNAFKNPRHISALCGICDVRRGSAVVRSQALNDHWCVRCLCSNFVFTCSPLTFDSLFENHRTKNKDEHLQTSSSCHEFPASLPSRITWVAASKCSSKIWQESWKNSVFTHKLTWRDES